MDFMTLLQNFGLPVATAAFFIWQYVSQAAEHKKDLRDIAAQSIKSIDAGTAAIQDSVEQIKLNNTALGDNSNTLSVVKNILSSRRANKNGTDIGN